MIAIFPVFSIFIYGFSFSIVLPVKLFASVVLKLVNQPAIRNGIKGVAAGGVGLQPPPPPPPKKNLERAKIRVEIGYYIIKSGNF